MPWVPRGLRDGVLTTRYPKRSDEYADRFAGSIQPIGAVRDDAEDDHGLPACPTGAIRSDDSGRVSVDRGRCILCGRCVREQPDRFGWVSGSEVAVLDPSLLVVPRAASDTDELPKVQAALAERTRRLGRSVHIRHIDVGSDGAEEWEIGALINPVYDVHRLGIFFTASPRHADLLMITGAGARWMAAPLARTLEAMPRPLITMAVGTDAISGGLIAPRGTGYAVAGGVGSLIPIDVWVPGSPPNPFMIMYGILLALGRVEQSAASAAAAAASPRRSRR